MFLASLSYNNIDLIFQFYYYFNTQITFGSIKIPWPDQKIIEDKQG